MGVNPLAVARTFLRALGVLFGLLVTVLALSAGTEMYARHIRPGDWWQLVAFWPYILRNMLPSLLGMFVAYWLAARFLKSLYGLDRLREGFAFLWRWRFGQAGFSPYLRVQKGEIDKGKEGVLSRIGGPGRMVIYHDSAVVLSHAGKLTLPERVKYPPLKAFEKVYRVVDLRPQHERPRVEAMTRDGIPISCEVDIRFRIRGGGQEPDRERPFPARDHYVLKAATSTWKCEPHVNESGEMDWRALLAFGETVGILRSILARYSLDQLIQPKGWEGSDPPYRQRIKAELERKLRLAAHKMGAQVLSVDLGDVEVQDDGVTKQWLAAWRAEWEDRAVQRQAEGEAAALAQVETAKAQAQADIILALLQALQTLVGDAEALKNRLDLLRVVAMLSHMAQDPRIQPFLSVETVRDLAKLQKGTSTTEG